MLELNFVTDMVEEQLAKGNLRWLANFNEIHRDYFVNDLVFPIYASGSLQERGFFLSRIFSALVTPKYKIHFLLYTSQEIDSKFLRKIILALKGKFGDDDWVFLNLFQAQPLGKDVKNVVTGITDRNVGVALFSLVAKEGVASNNVLGKGLIKQIKLKEPKFEAFDIPNYVKSFTITFTFSILFLVFLALSGFPQAIQPLTVLLMVIFSILIGHRIYKTRYHTTLTLHSKGFKLQEGKKLKEGKWSDYEDVSIYITPNRETCIRLHSKKNNLDIPISRTGLSRKETYNTIKQLVKKK
jgi:hypothetical protein